MPGLAPTKSEYMPITATRADRGERPPFARRARKHAQDHGADDNHIEAADGDDMRSADALKCRFQLGRDSTFIAQQDAGQQARLRFGQRPGDQPPRIIFDLQQRRHQRGAMAAARDFNCCMAHDAEHALTPEIIGVGEGIARARWIKRAGRPNHIAISDLGAGLSLDQDQPAGCQFAAVDKCRFHIQADLNAVVANDRLCDYYSGYRAGIAVKGCDFAASRNNRLPSRPQRQEQQQDKQVAKRA